MNIKPSPSWPEVSSNGTKPKTLPTDIFNRLSQATTEVEILQSGVEIIYQNLKCDRAVVYSMQSVSMCKITAEAVTPGYAQILNTTIEDPCFEARYIDKYQKGRVKAITNIKEAGMSSCHVANLEKIDVKSNLVVPLTAGDNSLYGLLVMHQCSRTREWQQTEVEFALSIANWLMKQVDRQQAYLNLQQSVAEEQKHKESITGITKEIYGAATSEAVLQIAADRAKEMLSCDRVVVYGLNSSTMGEIVAEATVPALAPILANVIKDPCFEYRYLESYEQGRVRAISNIYEAGMTPCYVDNLAKIGVKANLVAPIIWDNGKIYGLLVAHQCFDFREWRTEEIEHFKQIAFHTGLSLSKAKLQQESTLVATGLTELQRVKDSIERAQAKIDRLQVPIKNTGNALIEVNNLNKLLAREVNILNEGNSPQIRKNTKIIQIISRKMAAANSKLKNYLAELNSSKYEAQTILNDAVRDFNDK